MASLQRLWYQQSEPRVTRVVASAGRSPSSRRAERPPVASREEETFAGLASRVPVVISMSWLLDDDASSDDLVAAEDAGCSTSLSMLDRQPAVTDSISGVRSAPARTIAATQTSASGLPF